MDPPTITHLADKYLAGLRSYLTDEAAGSQLANALGREAVVGAIEILGLARIHDAALLVLVSPDTSPEASEKLVAQANVFFTEAILPIEQTHAAALATRLELAADQLRQHTLALEQSNREIQEVISVRHQAEAALKTCETNASEEHAESLVLEQKLHEIVRKIVCASEAERTMMSLTLQHEIAQALLGIKFRLLALESEASTNQMSFSQDISTTHWLVETSAKTLSRLIRDFSNHHE